MTLILTNPVIWVLGLVGIVAVLCGLRAILSYRAVASDAQADYDYKAEQGMIPKGLSQSRYIQIYRRVNNPRAAGYAASGLALILLTTPLIFWGLEWGLRMLYNLSGQDRVIEPGYLVWQFIIFFAVLIIWAGIAYGTARRYHRRAPASLQYEIEQALMDED